jgi:gluconokinase
MGSGIPLTDGDRWDWLISLRRAAIDSLLPSEFNNFQPPVNVVVSCSALKRKYRDVFRVAAYGAQHVLVHFIYLRLSEELLMQRITQRKGHYMKSDMVKSQLQAVEEPKGEWDVFTINVDGSREQVQSSVLNYVSGNWKSRNL